MDYSTLQRKDLVTICESRNPRLPTYGTREQILARLEKADAVPPPKETTMVQVAVGPDTGKDSDPGDDLLNALAPEPTPTPQGAQPPAVAPDPRDQMMLELAAQVKRLTALVEGNAAAAAAAGPAEVASAEAIARAAQGERVYRAEFPLLDGVELGEGLHAALIAQTATQARAAGYTTRGGARRYGWGKDDAGNRTALYEIYARK